MSTDAKKDFFVSYNRHDKAWAEWIAWILEESGYTVVIQAWDFRPGGNFVLDMQRAASEAERTISVLSENYLSSQFTQPEWASAFAQDPTGEKRSLIPIRIGNCLLSGMWSTIVYVDLVEVDEVSARDLVLQAVQDGRTKPDQPPQFPGQSGTISDRAKPTYPPNLIQNLPYGSINFVGREVELEQIHQQLQQSSTVAISAIAGMGGIGKTELALQYARKHCREGSYPGGLCWLRAREEVGTQIISFVRSCLDLTPPEDLELVEKVRWCWRRWREGAALLIFDDVQKYEDIELFLPPQESRFKVLMTSRSRFGSPVQPLQLDVLSEEKALELLRSLVGDSRVDEELARSKELCEWLGYLPLGVELVGRHLAKKRDLSIELLWQRLQEKRLEARAFQQAEPGMTASLGVAAAFELSWHALDEIAQQVAAVLSLFALVEIPWKLVEQCLPKFDAEELEDIRDQMLLGANLLKRVDQGMYQLHQLLREFFVVKREQRADDSDLQQRFYQVVIAEAKRVRDEPEKSLIRESTMMIAHLQEAMERLARPEQALDLATCLNWLAELYYAQGRYEEAEPLYVRSLSIHEQQLGADHLDVANSFNNLALLYKEQGRYEEAEPLYVRSLSIREQQLGTDHLDVATSLNNLAVLYRSQGRYEEAEPLYVRSLSIREQQLGTDHLDVATSLSNLAVLYQSQGCHHKAEPLLVRALPIWEQQLGTDHPDVATSLNNLAFLYHLQGRYEEAEPLLVRALSIREQQLGTDHPDVATSLNNLAVLYHLQGRYEDAEPLLLYSVRIRQEQLPADHPLSAKNLSNLAYLYDLQGRSGEAEALYLQAIPILSAKLEESHQWRQEASQRFRSLLQKALQENRTDELSDDPMTQSILQELRSTLD
ncbi:kinesin light chain [Leptolyngbya boryana NIES-2135]|jgi:tetratricopeptide (TPR) repeat protein|uniref:Kinesin light chain n=1 Tax=Leptolyngbya boryana NIES-2135 TaxID=1973484 RepID=A0A1Z4JL75_LEPBY|nr:MULTISPECIES: tetratricopeptide repeat protein [Leptolyngbya]BAY57347.1 kinesin light chain [Leptolyngbya boryana NIES-2135]MBD2366902.1 tetratricopeptide repeat protein [Leptolyngbya sp. FACHB-161]MBD2378010.1 tetratricopeptide repeat protein [Leptolyngbya sp. FACHB-238]MBD2398153.1 tetratricopeptide repeat protein [Leptolyngbya sp. FACHB-239]MBD2408786.1 tetratricopeptide repeat protein [Leptolyngbya sp. FACHB-402]